MGSSSKSHTTEPLPLPPSLLPVWPWLCQLCFGHRCACAAYGRVNVYTGVQGLVFGEEKPNNAL